MMGEESVLLVTGILGCLCRYFPDDTTVRVTRITSILRQKIIVGSLKFEKITAVSMMIDRDTAFIVSTVATSILR
jgi:hypothetical protein